MSFQSVFRRVPGAGFLSRAARRGDRREGASKQGPRLLLETLEPRILMSASPLTFIADPKVAQDLSLGIIDKLGVPTIQLTDTATSKVVLERAVAQTSQVGIKLSDQDDRITVASDFTKAVPVVLLGGAGSDTLLGTVRGGLTYTIDRADGGSVAGVKFDAIEKLQGAAKVSDLFVLKAGGSLTGGLDGGAGGNDSLRLTGSAAVGSVVYNATGADSGTIAIDKKGLAFAGLEPVVDTLTASNRVITGTAGDDAMSLTQDAGGLITVAGPTFEKITFGAPTTSLTVRGGDGNDALSIDSDLSMPGVALTLNGETITVANRTISLQGATAGALDFSSTGFAKVTSKSIDAVAGTLSTTTASVSITGSTITAGAVHLSALAKDANSVSATTAAALGFVDSASVTLTGSKISATGDIDVAAATDASMAAQAAPASGSSSGSTDAAVAVSVLTATSALTLTDSTLAAQGAVTLASTNTASIVTKADARGGASTAGAGAANSIVTGGASLVVGGATSITATKTIGLAAASIMTVNTNAFAAAGGVSGQTPRAGTLLARADAKTPEGAVRVAAAVAVNAIDNTAAVTLGGTLTAKAPGGLTVAGGGTHAVTALADSSAATSSTGVAPAVALNIVDEASSATVAGAVTFTGPSFSLAATEDSKVTASATSGLGSSSGTGIAGALALNDVSADATASLLAAGTLTLNGADLTVTAQITSAATALAKAAVSGGATAGVGASLALNFTGNDLAATLLGTLASPGAVALKGTGADTVTTTASGGAAGGTAIVPVLALSSSGNSSLVSIEQGTAFSATGLTLDNERGRTTATTANGAAAGAKAAAGAAIALTLGAPSLVTRIDRGITVSGAATVSSRVRVDDATKSTASPAGDGGKGGNADQQVASGLGFDKNQTGRTSSAPSAETSSGKFGAAAAIALDVTGGQSSATVDVNGKVTTGAAFSIEALHDVDSAVTADGSVVKASPSVGVGAAVAINALSLATGASVLGTVNAGKGIAIRAGGVATDASASKDVVSAKAVAGAGATSFGLAGALGLNVVNLDASAGAGAGASLSGGSGPVALSASVATDTTTVATSSASAGSGGSGVGIGIGVALALLDSDATATVAGGAAVTGQGGLSLLAAGTHGAHGSAQAGSTSGSVGVAPSTFIVVATDDTQALLPDGTDLSLKGPVTLQATHAVSVDGTAGSAGTGSTAGAGLSLTLAVVGDTGQAVLGRSVSTDGTVTVRAGASVDVSLTATASSAGGKADGAQSTADDQSKKEVDFANAKGGTGAAAPSADTSSGKFGLGAALALSLVNGQALAQVAAGKTVATTGAATVEALSDVDSAVTADGSVVKASPSVGVGAAVAINALSLATGASVLGTVSAGKGITIRAGGVATDASASKDVVSAKAVAGAGATSFGLAGALGLNVVNLDASAGAGAGASLSGGSGPVALSASVATDTTTVATSSASAGSGGSGVGIGIGVALALLDSDATATVAGGAAVTGQGGLSLLAAGTHGAHGSAQAGSTSGSVGVAPSTFIVVATDDTQALLPDGTDLSLKGPVTLQATHAVSVDGTAGSAGTGSTAGAGLSLTLAVVGDTGQAVLGRSVSTDGTVTVRAGASVDVSLTATASSAGGKADGAQSTADDQSKKEVDFANAKGGTGAAAPSADTSSGKFGLGAALALSLVNGQALAQVAAGKTVATTGAATVEALHDVDSAVTADGSVVKASPSVGVGAAVAINALSLATGASVLGTVNAGKGIAIRAGGVATDASASKDVVSAKAVAGAGATSFGLAGALGLNVVNLDASAGAGAGASLSGGSGPVALSASVATDTTTVATSSASAGSGGSGVGIGIGVALALLDSDATATVAGGAAVTGQGGLSLLAAGTHGAHGSAQAGSTSGSVGVAPSTFIVVATDDTQALLPDGTDLSLKGPVTLQATHAVSVDGTAGSAGTGSTAGAGLSLTLAVVGDTGQAVLGRSVSTDGTVTVRAGASVDVSLTATASSAGGKADGAQSTADDQSKKEVDFANAKGGTGAAAPSADTSSGKFGLGAALALSLVNGQALAQVAAGKTVATTGAATVEALSDVDSAVTADGSVVKASPSVGVGAAVAINALSLATGASVLGTVSAGKGITIRAGGVATDASASKDVVSAKAVAGAGATSFGLAGALGLNVVNLDASAGAGAGASLSGGSGPVALSASVATDTTTVATSSASAGSGGSGVGIGIGVALALLDSDATATVAGGAAVTGQGGLSLLAAGTHGAHGSAQAGSTSGSVGVAPSTFIVVATDDTQALLPDGTDLSLKGPVTLQATHAVSIDGTAGSAGTGSTAGAGLSLTLAVVGDTGQAVLGRSVSTDGTVTVRAGASVDVSLTATASSAGGKADGAQSTADDQSKKEVDFANAKGGTGAAAPSADTSSGKFGLGAALALSLVNGQALAQVAAGKTVATTGAATVEALSDVDSAVTADGSVVKASPSVGVGAAVAINALSLATGASVLGTVSAGKGITIRAGGVATDASASKDVVSAKAVAGAGATSFGLAGALGLNVVNLDASAGAGAGASLSGGSGPVALSASVATDTTTVATSSASAGSGGSGVGIGIGVALALLDSDATATVAGGAAVTGQGGLSLLAAGTHGAHGSAQAGSTSGSVGVAPSTFIVVATDDTQALLPDGTDLSLKGPVTLQATHAVSIDGTAGSAGTGSTAGAGLSLTLAVVGDTGQAVLGRSVSTDGTVTVRAGASVDVSLTATASSAGGKADGAQSTADDQSKKELDFANAKGGTGAAADSATAPDANGNGQKVGIAGAISLSLVNAKAVAQLPVGKFVKTDGAVTIETVGDVDSTVKADGRTVDGSQPNVGVGVGVALNVIDFTNSASVSGTVTSGGLAIHALAPPDPAEAPSTIVAIAISGAGAKKVGIAGAFAANFTDIESTAVLAGTAVETSAGAVDIRSITRSTPQAFATSNAAAIGQGDNGGSSGVGIGLSFALNFVGNVSTATVNDGATLSGGGDVTIAASGADLTTTKAVAGAGQGSVGISPSVALVLAHDTTAARLGTGTGTNNSGKLTVSAQHKVTADTTADASVKANGNVGVGAAVALNIMLDSADAGVYRNISSGKDVRVAADLAASASATSAASTQGVSPKGSGEPTTTDGQVASLTNFGNSQAGTSAAAPQVAKTTSGTGSEKTVGVSAALSLNVMLGHARAILPSTITVASSGGGVAVVTGLDVDAAAKADGSTAQQAKGIGVAVAINVVNVDNTALIAAPTTAKGAVTISATMSTQGDGTDTFSAVANAGAGATSVGVAGAVALNLISAPTSAQTTAPIDAGGGSVTIAGAAKSDTATTATSAATGKGGSDRSSTGVGASFALTVLDLDVTAQVPDTIAVSNAGAVTIKATGDHAARTLAQAGSAGNVSVSPAVALTVATSDTSAYLGTGAALNASGSVLVEAAHSGDYTTKADASAGGKDVAVGAAIAVGIVLESGVATIARDVTAGGDVRVRARNPMASAVEADGGASGNSDKGSNTADSEGNSAVNNNSNIKNNKDVQAQGGTVALPKAGDQASSASSTSQTQTGKGSGGVGVAAAIGVNVVSTNATASILPALTIKAGGAVEVSSALQVDGSAKAFGIAIKDTSKDTAVGAGVAVNVVDAENQALVGDKDVIRAVSGLTVSAGMAQRGAKDLTNDMVVQSAAAGGAKKKGIAGSVSVDVVDLETTASIGKTSDVIVSSGAATLAAAARFTVQNLAGSAAFGSDIGVGAAVVVQVSSIDTTASLGDGSVFDARGGLSVTADSSYVPKVEKFKSLLTLGISSGAFGGGASDESTAVGGSVDVNVINMTTQALIGGSVQVNGRNAATGAVKLAATSAMTLFSGAGGIGASLGNTGVGIGIDVTIVNQKTLASIGDKAGVATGGDVSVTATSRNQQTSIAGSFGASKDTGGAGSLVVNLFNLGSDALKGTRALVGADATVAAGGKVSVLAGNPIDKAPDTMTLVAGSAGAGQTAVGIASVIAIREDVFQAAVGDRSAVGMTNGLDVFAQSGRSANIIAAAGAGGVKAGGAGSLIVSTFTETASATIGQNAVVTGTGANATVRLKAQNVTTLVKVAGAAGFSGSKGIGAGLDVGVLTKTTEASIGVGAAVDTGGSVEIRAFSKEDLTALAASAGASGELAIAGSADVEVYAISTRAFIEGGLGAAHTRVAADGNVIIESSDENDIDQFAGGLSASGSNAIGASTPVLVINKITAAFVGPNATVIARGLRDAGTVRSGGFVTTYVEPPRTGTPEVSTTLTSGKGFTLTAKGNNDDGLPGSGSVGDPQAGQVKQVAAGSLTMRGVAISATGYDNIGQVGIAGGAAGSVAVDVTGVVNVSNIKTTARVESGASINEPGSGAADQSVLVVGSEDYSKLTVSVGAAASGSVAVAPSVAVDVINLTTEAIVMGTARIDAVDTVAVRSRAAEDIDSVVASLAASGSVGVAGSPAIIVLTSTSTARIGTIAASGDTPATVKAGGSVVVEATDDTSVLAIAGTAGFAGTAGIGAGVSVIAIDKATMAQIASGSQVDAGGATGTSGVVTLGGLDSRFGGLTSGLIVEAGSSEDLQTFAIAGGVGGQAGVAGGFAITYVDSDTAATIGDASIINASIGSAPQNVRVAASNSVSVVSVAGGLGGGTAGVAGALGVGIVRNGTQASIGANVKLQAGGAVSVLATSDQDIVAVTASAGLGGFAGAISFGIWVIGGAYDAGGGAASESAFTGTYQSTVDGSAFGGFQSVLNGYKGVSFAAADVSDAADTVNLHTSTLQTGDAVVYKADPGGSVPGLVNGQTYFVIRTAGPGLYKLAASASAAEAGTAINLGAATGPGTFLTGDNGRSQAGLQRARTGLVNNAPDTSLASLLPASGTGPTASEGTVALVKAGAQITARRGMQVVAKDDLTFTQVSGQVAAGGTGIGGAFATLIHTNPVIANVGDNVSIGVGGTGLAVAALSTETIAQVAAGAAGAGSAAIVGSVSLALLTETTQATVGNTVKITGTVTVDGQNPDVVVRASDDTTITDVAGALGFGGGAAIGVGVDVQVIGKVTTAAIGQAATITTAGSTEVRAGTNENIVSVGIAGGLAGAAAVNGAAAIVVASIGTEALIAASTATNIVADGNVIVEAASHSEYDLWGGSFSAAAAAAVGGAAAVPVITKTVKAEVGDGASVTGRGLRNATSVRNGSFIEAVAGSKTDVKTTGAGPRDLDLGSPNYSDNSSGQDAAPRDSYNAGDNAPGDSDAGTEKASAAVNGSFRGVAVSATNSDDVSSFGMAAGAAGVASVQLAGAVQVVNVETLARVGVGAKVNQAGTGSNQDVLVASGNDFRGLDVGASAAVAVAASIAPSASVQVVNLSSRAIVEKQAALSAGRSIVVAATGSEKIISVSAALAVAGFAGVALAPNVLVLDSETQATLGNAGGASATASGSVAVLADDKTNLIGVVGALGGGVAGIGAGVNIALVTKQTTATIGDGSQVKASGLANLGSVTGVLDALGTQNQDYAVQVRKAAVGGVVVQATSREDMTTLAAAGGVGLVGIAGGVNILVDDSDTVARIGSNASVSSGGAVVVGAANTVESFAFAGSLAAGFVGIGGAVNVGTIRNGVDASIGSGAAISSGTSAEVIALSRKDLDALSIGAAAGLVGATGSIGILTIGGNVDTTYDYNQRNADGSAGPSKGDDALGDGATGWNSQYDGYANGNSSPGGSNGSILNSRVGNGGSNSRVGAAIAGAKPKVSAAKPTTSITAQLAAGGDLQGTVAHVDGGALVKAGGSVRVSAQDATTVTSTVGSFSGGAVSLGAPVTIVSLNMQVHAIVAAGVTIKSGASVAVQASQITAATGFAFAGQGGLGALGAQVVVIQDAMQQTAEVRAGASVTATGDVSVTATAQENVKARAFGATFSLVGLGVSLASVQISGLTQAYNDGTVSAAKNVTVSASTDLVADSSSFGVGVAAGANLNGAVSIASITRATSARTGTAASTAAGGQISVAAAASMNAASKSFAISVGLGAGLGVSYASASLTPSVTANAGGTLKPGSGLNVTALFNVDGSNNQLPGDLGAHADAETVGAGLAAGAAGAIAIAEASPAVLAQITDKGVVVAQPAAAANVTIKAFASDQAAAKAGGIAFGLGAGLGASITSATLAGSTTARIGSGVKIGSVVPNAMLAVGDITVQARTTNVASADTAAVAGGLLAGVSVNSATTRITTAIAAKVDAGVAIDALSLNLLAIEDKGTATSTAKGVSVAGVGAVGFSQANAAHATTVKASVGGGARALVYLAGDLTILATTSNAKAQARADASGGALLGSVQVNKATASSSGSTTARLDDTDIWGTETTAVQIKATSSATVGTTGSGRSLSLIAGIGDVSTNSTLTDATLAAVGDGAHIGNRFDTGDGYNITYVGSIEVAAVSSGSGNTNAQGAAGGLVASPSVSATIAIKPTARATIGVDAQMFARNSITVSSTNRAEGDAALSGDSVGLVAVGSTTIAHNVIQTAETLIGGGALLQSNTITLTSNGGIDPAAPRNYTVTADGTVASSDAVVITGHGLQTGDIIQLGTDNPTFGGISTGRILPIIRVDDNTIRFGRIVDGSAVDANRDTITFNGPHFLQTGDKVLYGPVGGAAVAYWAYAVSDTAIKLLDFDPTTPAGAARLLGTGFTKSAVNAATDTITIAGNGFANGSHVTYRAALTQFSFGVGDVDVVISGTRPNGKPQLSQSAGSDDIYLPGHTFNTGDLVTYSVTGGNALGGLGNNTVYQVVKVDGNFIQLKPKAGGSVIAISSNMNQLGATHTLKLFGSGPVGGLVDGNVYVVQKIDADKFKLTDLNGTVIDLGATGVGTHHFAFDGVDLGATTGSRQVYLDLQAGGTTTLQGVGGVALDTIIADPGDGVSRVTAEGLSIGLGASTANLAAARVTSVVRTVVSGGSAENPTQLIANSAVNVTASGKAFASSVADGDAGGLFAFPNAFAQAFVTGTTEALIGETGVNRSTYVNESTLSISATALYGAVASSGGVGGGLIAVGGTNAKASTTYLTQAGLGQGTSVYGGNAAITAHTSHSESTNIRNSAAGLGAGSSAGRGASGSFAAGDNKVIIGNGSTLQSYGSVSLLSLVDNSDVRSKSRSYSGAAIGGSHATATAHADDQVGVVLMPGSVIHGDQDVTIQATVGSYNIVTNASAELDALGGGTGARSDNNVTVRAYVDAQQGATVQAKANGASSYGNPALFVAANVTITRDDSQVDADGALFGSEDEDRDGSDASRRDIVWNADVVLLRDDSAYKSLQIDATGVVTRADGITVEGGHGVGYNAGSDGVITVDDIASNGVGRAIFRTNDGPVNTGTITGTLGTWTVQKGASTISISNYSNSQLQINNIDALGKSTALGNATIFGIDLRPYSRAVSLESSNNQAFKFDISTVYGSAGVFISNTLTTSGDIVLNGLIDNPLGYTYVSVGYGSILQGTDSAVIRSNFISLSTNYYGGSIGTSGSIVGRAPQAASSGTSSSAASPQTGGIYYVPVKLEFVQSPGRAPRGTFYANQLVALDITTRLRDPSQSSSTVTLSSVTSRSSYVHIDFHQAQNDTILPPDAPYGIVVGTTQFAPSTTNSDNAYYREYYQPDFSAGTASPDALAAFGQSSGATAPATYNITSISPRGTFEYTADNNVTVNLPSLLVGPNGTGPAAQASGGNLAAPAAEPSAARAPAASAGPAARASGTETPVEAAAASTASSNARPAAAPEPSEIAPSLAIPAQQLAKAAPAALAAGASAQARTVARLAVPFSASASLGREVLLKIGRTDMASDADLAPTPDAVLRFFGSEADEATAGTGVAEAAVRDAGGDDLWTLLPVAGTELRRGRPTIAW